MTEEKAVSLLQKGKSEGLAWIINHYAPYISIVIWSIFRGRMSHSDTEKVASDVFFAL